MKQKILITSALPYANGPLHFGHIAGAYLPGDCYARFARLQGNEVLYICGSDEYGVAITLSAEKEGRTPQDHVDHYHKFQRHLFQQLNFSFDHFSRTTCEEHAPLSKQFFLELLHNGWIEAKITDQLWSEQEQRFLADRYVEGICPRCRFEQARGDECPKCGASYDAVDLLKPYSKITKTPLIRKPTKHWFLLLDRMQDRLTQWLEKKNWKSNVIHFIKGYIEELHPRAITRDMSWGVPVPLPDAEGKVLYVWFDAPIGYLSATKEWAKKQGSPEKWKEFWCDPNTKLVQFIGKDNIPFHAAIFPAMIMGQNQPYKLVDELPANEFYNLEGRKFNKSEGWFIDLEDFFSKFSADQIRYTIAANAPETSDSDFTWKDFQSRCNADLVGKYGNFVHRTLTFLQSRRKGKIPPLRDLEEEDRAFLHTIDTLGIAIAQAYDTFHLRRAAKGVMELAQEGNIYFDRKSPWKDAKDQERQHRMDTTLHCCLRCIQMLALTSFPILPQAAQEIWQMLGHDKPLGDCSWEEIRGIKLVEERVLPTPTVLFQKVEDAVIAQEIEQLQGQLAKKQEDAKHMLSFSDFQKLDLRVAKVLEAKEIEKSKKLLYLTVDVGGEKRNIVSGIRPHYRVEELIGKNVIIVANLAPATVMGYRSEGMLLAGADQEKLEILEVQSLPPGTAIG